MEIQLVHTTGSPSRHDSDSESSYDKKRQMKSSSDVALHRKQTRRCKKQMSERQRRKRMNNSMDKLGLLVYGKTFKDGLKVDKATLLKDAYEKLQTMKDDYHKGYETAISSTQSFLDSLDGCPQQVKDALTRHLNATLKVNMHRCQSSSAAFPPEESNSDSCSPQPLRASSLDMGSAQDFDARCPSSDVNPKIAGRRLMAGTPCTSDEREAFMLAQRLASRLVGASHTRQEERLASPCRAAGRLTPACSNAEACRCDGEAPRLLTTTGPSTSSSMGTPSSSLQHTSHTAADRQRQQRSGHGQYPLHPYPFPHLAFSTSTPTCTPSSTSTPKILPYVTPFAPQNPLYLGSNPPSLVYTASVDGSPSGTVYGVPDNSLPHSRLARPLYPAAHPLPTHTPAHYAGPSRADDSGYISPVVPSPRTPLSVGVFGGVKKRYLKEMGHRTKGRPDDSDEENDKEVEQVFSRAKHYDSDSPSLHSD